jgi:hypothetical protein
MRGLRHNFRGLVVFLIHQHLRFSHDPRRVRLEALSRPRHHVTLAVPTIENFGLWGPAWRKMLPGDVSCPTGNNLPFEAFAGFKRHHHAD